MTARSNFLKSELSKTYNLLNISFEYADLFRLEDQNRFIRIFDLLMEIRDKSENLKNIVKGNYNFV